MSDLSKEAIVHAFNSLIEKRPFDAITVKMITEEAGVSRATFYRHFKDKYDVMNYNYKKILDTYFHADKCETFEDLFFYIFRCGKEEWAPLKRAFETDGANSLNHFIYEYSYEVGCAAATFINGGELSESERFELEIICQGASYMFEKWVGGVYSLTPREAAKAFYDLLPEKYRGEIWRKTSYKA